MLSIEEYVKMIIAEQFDIPQKNINIENDFIQDFGADSLDIFEMCMRIEKEFNVEIDNSYFQKVKDVIFFIERNID